MARPDRRGTQGPTQRQLRVAELIRRALSDMLARGDTFDPDLDGASVTVGEVRTSSDLRQAQVYVLPLGGQNAEVVIEALNRNRAELRRGVTKAVTLKFSPELKFLIDTSFDQMDETRRLLSDPVVQRDVTRPDADDADAEPGVDPASARD